MTLVFQTDTTSSGVDYGDYIVRSNYNMDDVVLLIEASHVIQTQVYRTNVGNYNNTDNFTNFPRLLGISV